METSVADREVTVFNSQHMGGNKSINAYLMEIDVQQDREARAKASEKRKQAIEEIKKKESEE